MLKDAIIVYFKPITFDLSSSAYLHSPDVCQQIPTQTGLALRESNPRRHVLYFLNDQSFFWGHACRFSQSSTLSFNLYLVGVCPDSSRFSIQLILFLLALLAQFHYV